jgi:hypothetical protein
MSDEGLTQLTGTAQGDTDTGQGDAGQGASEEGVITSSWMDSLPEDLKGNEELKSFKDTAELAKALLEVKGKVKEPPDKPESYQIQVPENFPVDKDFLASAKSWAHQAGLSQTQFEAFAKPYVEAQAQMIAAAASAEQKGVDSLKAEWGPDFEVNVTEARNALRRFAGEDFKLFLDESRLGNNPSLIMAFYRIGRAISDDKLIEGDGANLPQMKYTQAGTPMLDEYNDMPRK